MTTTKRASVRRAGWLAVPLLVAALATGCSSSKGGGASTTSSSPAGTGSMSSMSMPAGGSSAAGSSSSTGDAVTVKNFSFTPMSLTVPVGTTVTWTFDDSAQHTVTAKDKSFSSPALANGKTYSHTFNTAGTYDYICSIHQYMTGTIIVK